MPPSVEDLYLAGARREFQKYKQLADGAMAQVDDQAFFTTLDPEANSIAILVKHLSGNARSRWTDFLHSDGEKPDRHRDSEFIITGADTRAALLTSWETSWDLLFHTLDDLNAADLLRTVTIRDEAHLVLEAINRQLTHYAYHVGQIVLLAKHAQSARWQTLSVPRGGSDAYNAAMGYPTSPAAHEPAHDGERAD